MDNLEANDILHDPQHGFRKHRSCESQLIITINHLAKSFDNGDKVELILLDFMHLTNYHTVYYNTR